jgi:hypothetical protein
MAYNVRKNKSLDHDPAEGPARRVNRMRELGAWAVGIVVMYAVYWLVRRFLF